ncbi:Autophagy-related protein 22 [Hondaea fermentalgiana]|uniref:Autophagy-related protein 22 n=1 Tax=Hondaea fermentalgiana TaxID=2315210 RepID=A0A2R5GLS0_9STRA|nr:Autophagy-related protein 22 [Hondaea fermentalgiana]|eukprot:GBG31259.1 Autophagy-related protein 22 [Hondaea fermentalgiana]
MAAVVGNADSGHLAETGWRTWPCYWNWRYIKYDDREITGYALTGACRGPMIGFISVFSVLALTGMAESVQDCATRTVTIGGATILTSSVVSTTVTMEGIINACISPLFGALTDAGSYRTIIFRASLCCLALSVVASGITLFFDGHLGALVAFAFLLIFVSLCYDAFQIVHNSYLPEIGHTEEERTLYTSKMYVLLNSAQLTYALLAIGLALVVGVSDNSIVAPQIGVVVAIIIWSLFAFPGMAFMQPRPKKTSDILPAGFLGIPRVARMIMQCFRQYNQIGLYMIQYATGVTGASAVVSLASSYMLSIVGISSFGVQIVSGLTLIMTVPGALLTSRLSKKFGDLRRTNLFVLSYWFILILLVPFLLTGEVDPDPEASADDYCSAEEGSTYARTPTQIGSLMQYVFPIFWGLGIGAIFPVNVAFFAEIVPGSQESAFFGLRTFASKIFAFFPPLLYTLINESAEEENKKFAIFAVLPFFLIGLIATYLFDMEKAKAEIADTLVKRYHKEGEEVTAGALAA